MTAAAGAGPDERAGLAPSWLVAAVATAGMLAALLVLTVDLGGTAGGLRRGVGGMDRLIAINGDAVASAGAVAPARLALDLGAAEVAAMAQSLAQGVAALDRMNVDLSALSASLRAAGESLGSTVGAVGTTGGAVRDAEASLARTADLSAQAHDGVRALGLLLDETAARAASLERKLRILRIIPVGA